MQSLKEFFGFVYDWVFILQLLTVSVSVILVYDPLKKGVRSAVWFAVQLLLIFGLGTLLNALLFTLASVFEPVRAINFPLSWLVTIMIYLSLTRRKFRVGDLIMAATLYVTVIAMADLGRTVSFLCGEISDAVSWEWLYVLADALIFAFSLFIRKLSLAGYNEIPLVSIIGIGISSFVSAVLIFARERSTLTSSISEGMDGFYGLVLAAIYLISVSGYLMVYFQCKERKEKMTLVIENRLLESDKQMLTLSQQAITSLKGLRHDIKNQYKVMELMLEEEKYDQLKEYFRSVNDWFIGNSGMHFIDSGNPLVDSILNMEYMKAAGSKVQLTTKTNCPAKLPFDSSDFCRILVNLIDNAIEATALLQKDKPSVDCKIAKNGEYLYISVINRIPEGADPKEILRLKTGKKDPENHGYGHRIVAKIVEKYNGYVNYTIEDREFLAEVMLELSGGEGGKTV